MQTKRLIIGLSAMTVSLIALTLSLYNYARVQAYKGEILANSKLEYYEEDVSNAKNGTITLKKVDNEENPKNLNAKYEAYDKNGNLKKVYIINPEIMN